MMKKVCVFTLAALMTLMFVSCAPNNGNDPSDGGEGNLPEKPNLMFLIDEGIAGKGLFYQNRNDFTKITQYLDNIITGVEPLTEKYEVSFLIYPTWHYNENGYDNKDASEGLNRIAPELQYGLKYIASKGYKFYLEIYSSGIRTNQNGELGILAPAPLYYGDDVKRRSLPMDMEAVKALKTEYGDYFAGLRFHELIGSHQIGLNDRENGKEDVSHAWVVEDAVVRSIIDTCKETGLQLVWGDHSWNDVSENERDERFSCFKTWLDYAIDEIDRDKLILNWSNNSWKIHQYIYGSFQYENYRNSLHGASVQSWFWQEMDSSTLTYDPGNGSMTTKWYVDADMDCPPEIMAAFTMKAVRNGDKIIQFEPTQYFFNTPVPRTMGDSSEAAVEGGKKDYSARTSLKRFIHYLLNEDAAGVPSSDLKVYFDENENKFKANKESDPAKRYYQTILTAYDGEITKVFDRYNNDMNAWYENSADRYVDGIFTDDIIAACRMNITFSSIDEMILLKRSGKSVAAEIYNYRNGLIATIESVFDDNENGKVVGAAALNAVTENVISMSGDSDELVIAREKDGKLHYELYKVKSKGAATLQMADIIRVENDAQLLTGYISANEVLSQDSLGLVAVRKRNAVLKSSLRPCDEGMLAVRRSDNDSVSLSGKIDGKSIEKTIQVGGEAVCVATADINGDFKDELAIVIRSDDVYRIVFIDLNEFALISGDTIDLGNYAPTALLSTRVSTYTKAF